MTYAQARKALRKVGTAHASGDALRVMYADLLSFQHGGKPVSYFRWLRAKSAGADDSAISRMARELLRDREKSWEALMELPDLSLQESA